MKNLDSLNFDEMYAVIANNDTSYDGIFFYAVKTTGIYCKPSCKSKQPKRENIEIFKCVNEAKVAGYRSCKKCKSG